MYMNVLLDLEQLHICVQLHAQVIVSRVHVNIRVRLNKTLDFGPGACLPRIQIVHVHYIHVL